MKTKKWILNLCFSLLILFCLFITTLHSTNLNILNAIQQKIYDYLFLRYKIKYSDVSFDIIRKNSIPKYKLYEIEIDDVTKIGNRVDFRIKVCNFFDRNDFKIVNVSVRLNLQKKILYDVSKKIKIIYQKDSIKIITYGKVLKADNNVITAVTDFGKKIKCRIIDNDTVEVIE